MKRSTSGMHSFGFFALLAVLALSFLLAGCSAGASPTPKGPTPTPTGEPSDGSRVTVTITDEGFDPQTVTLSIGTSVLWACKAVGGHSVVFVGFESWRLGNGEFYNHVFGAAGTYEYHCGEHSSEKGTIIVK